MAEVRAERCTAEIDGDFVVFLIAMRVNRFWKPHKWLPVAAAMPRMLAELARAPDLGLLHARTHFGFPNIMVVQYWRSFAHLYRYATDRNLAHLPAWKAFNQAIASNGDVGIWHETYCIEPGAVESIYINMPPWGLSRAFGRETVVEAKATARQRLSAGKV